jgi:hypothetical protein
MSLSRCDSAIERTSLSFRVARSAGLATILASALLAPIAANAADSHYQEQRTLACANGFCTGKFPKAGSNRVLVLESVICEGSVENGAIEQAYVSFDVKGKQFILPLALDWQRSQGNFESYVFSRSAKIQVPGGEAPSGVLAYDGAVPSGRCILSGTVRSD